MKFLKCFSGDFPANHAFSGLTNGNSQAKINVMCKNSIDKLKDTREGAFIYGKKK